MKAKQSRSELSEALFSLMPYFKKAMLFTVTLNLLSLAPIGYMKDLYGPVINSGSYQTLAMVTIPLLGSLLTIALLDWVRSRVCAAAAVEFDKKMGQRVFDATFTANLRQDPPGSQQALRDLKAIRGFIASHYMGVLMDAPVSIFFMGLVYYVNLRMGIIATLGAAVMFLIGVITERKVQPALTKAQQAEAEANSYFNDSARNVQVIEAMGMMTNIHGKWQRSQQRFLAGQALASDRQVFSSALSKFVLLSQGSVILGVGCWLTIMGYIRDGGAAMIIASILGGRAIHPLVQVISSWKQVGLIIDSFERLQSFLDAVPVASEKMSMPAPKGALWVENIVAQAPGTKKTILQEIAFKLPAGETLAVIGPSGSGKSSLAKLIVGIWPTVAGNVRLDGVDVYSWNKDELGPHLGYLPQDIELFDGTLADNIARFGEVDREKLEQAARLVGVHEMIMELPEQYDTQIGDDGCIFSGGQRQRVGLARAVYGNPRLLVLDEPNSSLDKDGHRALMEALQSLKAQGCSVVVITHREGILSVADKILWLRNGRLKAFGPRDLVLAKMKKLAEPATPAEITKQDKPKPEESGFTDKSPQPAGVPA